MENRLQPTFIPHRPNTPGDPYARPKGPTSFFMVIAVVLFLLMLVAGGGLYVYKGQLTQSNEAKKAQVQEAINNFEPELTKELSVLKARIDIGKQLLENHTAFSLLLALLQINTVQPVRFTELSYVVSQDKKISLTLKGESRSYNAIAFQSDVFSKLQPVKTPVFGGLDLDDKGNITFGVTAELDPASVSYKNLVEALAPVPVQQAQVATSTPSTATSTPAGASSATTTAPQTTSTTTTLRPS